MFCLATYLSQSVLQQSTQVAIQLLYNCLSSCQHHVAKLLNTKCSSQAEVTHPPRTTNFFAPSVIIEGLFLDGVKLLHIHLVTDLTFLISIHRKWIHCQTTQATDINPCLLQFCTDGQYSGFALGRHDAPSWLKALAGDGLTESLLSTMCVRAVPLRTLCRKLEAENTQ